MSGARPSVWANSPLIETREKSIGNRRKHEPNTGGNSSRVDWEIESVFFADFFARAIAMHKGQG